MDSTQWTIDDIIRLLEVAKDLQDQASNPETGNDLSVKRKKSKRKPSAYNKRYGRAFKKLAPKYKKKNGQWKKDGFKRCSAAARRMVKK